MKTLFHRRATFLLALVFASLFAAGCHSAASSSSGEDANPQMSAQQKAALKQHKQDQDQ